MSVVVEPADGVRIEAVVYPAEGDATRIDGLLYRPQDTSQRAPAVVVMHGGPNTHEMKSEEYLSLALARAGYVVLAGTYRQRTGGPYDNEDAAGCLTYLGQLPEVDPNRLGMAGHSRGGFVAVRLAGTDPRVKSVVSLGAGTGHEDLDERNKDYSYSHFVELYRFGGGTPESNRRRRTGLSPGLDELRRVKVPILWIHGTRDFSSPPERALRAYEAVRDAGNTHARLEMIPKMDHFWGHPQGPMHGRVAEIAVGWFDETLKMA